MVRKGTHSKARLTEHDRLVLDKYTKFYTNYIESNTARNDFLEDERTPKKG